MSFKLGLLITFLFVTVNATTENRTATQLIETVWRNSTSSYDARPNWIEGLQKYSDDIIASFGAFPSKFSAQVSLVHPALEKYLTKVTAASNSRSKIVSSGANRIAEVLSQVKVDPHTAQGIINEFSRVLPMLMNEYRGIVTNLTTPIGRELVSEVNGALTNAENEFQRYMREFNAGNANGQKIDIDYEPVMTRSKTLTKAVSLTGTATLPIFRLANPEVQDALVVLNLVLEHVMICTYGLSSCKEVILWEQKCKESQSC